MSAADTATPEQLAEAEAAASAAAEAAAADHRAKPTRDPKPRKRAKRKRASSTSTAGDRPLTGAAAKAALRSESARLEARLAELLAFPAVPAMMFSPDLESKVFLSEHFTLAGPRTARELVELSETSPELRRVLVRITTGSSAFAVAFAVLGYVAPPVLWTLGMRQQAQRVAVAASGVDLDPEQLARMMAADAPAAAHEPNGATPAEPGSEPAAAAPGAASPEL